MTEALAPPLPADTQGAAGNQLHDGVLGPDDVEEFPCSTYVFITHFFFKKQTLFQINFMHSNNTEDSVHG